MTDIESRVSEVLARRVQRPIDVERLRANAVRRATKIRRRRLAACAVAVVVVVVGVIGWVRLPAAAPTGGNLPLETAAPAGGIGSDPGLLHFDVDLSVFGGQALSTQWVSGIGYEALHVYRDDERPWVDVQLDPTESTLTERLAPKFAGPPVETGRAVIVGRYLAPLQQVTYAGITSWLLRWQPAPEVFAAVIVVGDDKGLAVAVARAVRLDRVQRCVMPLRLNELPAGARWKECQTLVHPAPFRWIYSGLTLERSDGKQILIWADGRRDPGRAASFRADRTIGGYPAQWLAGGSSGTGLWIPEFGPIDLFITTVPFVFVKDGSSWLTEVEARWLAERLRPIRDTDNPASWPRRAVG